MGGGVHLDLIHELDYVYWLLGAPNVIKRTLRKQSTLEINSFDFAHYLLEYPTFTVNITLNYYRVDRKRKIELVMEDATWQADLIDNQIIDHMGCTIYQKKIDTLYTYREQIAYFVHKIQAELQPMNTFTESLNVLKICLLENE